MHIVVAIALGVIYFMPNSVQCNVAVTKLNDANFEEFVHQYEVCQQLTRFTLFRYNCESPVILFH